MQGWRQAHGTRPTGTAVAQVVRQLLQRVYTHVACTQTCHTHGGESEGEG